MLRIDPDLLKQVEVWANDEFRSTNSQIEWIIHEALKKTKRLKNKNNTEQKSKLQEN